MGGAWAAFVGGARAPFVGGARAPFVGGAYYCTLHFAQALTSSRPSQW